MSQLAMPLTTGEFLPDDLAARLESRDTFACYAKTRTIKDAFAVAVMERHPGSDLLYLCPKASLPHVKERFPRALAVSWEQLAERDALLRALGVAGEETPVIFEGVSRYTILSSDKFNFCQRLRMLTRYRYLIDSTPFTRSLPKLYLPYSYLDREILGYSNGWAFEYNYYEEDGSGNRRRAHDLDFLAEKVSPASWQAYDSFLPRIRTVDSVQTCRERAAYAARKEELFDLYDNPRKIVTELCDCANMMASRYERLARLLSSLTGRVLLYTNIVKNNPLVKRFLKAHGGASDLRLTTYMTHDNEPLLADHIVFFETPINANRVRALDVLADVPPGVPVWHFRNDAKADALVYGECRAEWDAIDAFTQALAANQQRKEQLR